MIQLKSSVLFVVILNCLIAFSSSSKSHPVTTFLNAKWFRTPVCLEIAEYLSDESPVLYWDYLEKLNGLETPLHQIGFFQFHKEYNNVFLFYGLSYLLFLFFVFRW